MNTINRENYEEYCLDYHEGNLSEELKKEFDEFIKENPDLGNDLQNVELYYLPKPEEIVFVDKKDLMKKAKPVVRRLQPMYWKWAVAAACFAFIIAGVLFVQMNNDIPTFADVNNQDEVNSESLSKVDIQSTNSDEDQLANLDNEDQTESLVANRPKEVTDKSIKTNKVDRQPNYGKNDNSSNSQTLALQNIVQRKSGETSAEPSSDFNNKHSTDNVKSSRLPLEALDYLDSPNSSIAFEQTSNEVNLKDIPVIKAAEGRRRGLFGKRSDLEERGLLSDEYAYSVSKEELKESLTPDTYTLDVNIDDLKESLIPESFAAVFK